MSESKHYTKCIDEDCKDEFQSSIEYMQHGHTERSYKISNSNNNKQDLREVMEILTKKDITKKLSTRKQFPFPPKVHKY